VQILRVNRNAILLIDSDRRTSEDLINDTKSRLVEEMTNLGCLAWISMGKEIENYIPFSALQKHLPNATTHLGQYEDISTYIDTFDRGGGAKFKRNKVLFAESVLPFIDRH